MGSFFIKAALLLLVCSLDSVSATPEPCSMLVIKPHVTYSKIANTTIQCCDNWCLTYCEVTTYHMVTNTVYVQESKCCPGYGGMDCYAVCTGGCNRNQECTAPNTCTCLEGWDGEHCQQVMGLETTDVSTSSVSLTWAIPVDAENVYGYFVLLEGDTASINNTIVGVANETTVEGLEPFSSYQACVVPLLVEGNGTENCINVITAEQAPSIPPSDVIVSGLTQSDISVQWSHPSQPNGIITSYTLYINYTNGSNVHAVTLMSAFTLHLLEGLDPNQMVGVSISATTGGGEGPSSAYMFGQTTGTPPTAVTPSPSDIGSVTFTSLSDTTVELSWQPPATPIAQLLLYQLTVTDTSSTLSKYFLRDDQMFKVMLSLETYIPYSLVVLAKTESGDYSLLHNRTFFIKEGAPSIHPSNIEAHRLTEKSIRISWTPLTLYEARGFLTNYTISYFKTVDTCIYTSEQTVLWTENTELILDSVAIQEMYCISVFASTAAGNGPLSSPVLVPLYEHSPFTLHLMGVEDCERWLLTDLSLKLNKTREKILVVLNRGCSCINSDNYFYREYFICDDSCGTNSGTVTFTGSIIGTQSTTSMELIAILQQWLDNTDPALVVVQGVALRINSECNVTDTRCTSVGATSESDSFTTAGHTVYSVIIAILIILWISTVILGIFYIRHINRNRTKSISQESNLHVQDSDSNNKNYIYTNQNLTTVT